MKHLLAAALFVFLAVSPSRAGDLEDGIAAYETEEYERAYALLLPLAEQGNARAQFFVGLAFGFGQGVTQDDVVSADWFEKAALQGHRAAQFNLARAYFKGLGRDVDYNLAFRFTELSAHQCYLFAQGFLAALHWRGYGTPKDHVRGYAWALFSYARGYEAAFDMVTIAPVAMTNEELTESKQMALALADELACPDEPNP